MKIHVNQDGSFDLDVTEMDMLSNTTLDGIGRVVRSLNKKDENGHAGKKIVFLQKIFADTLECFRLYPDGLTSPEVASLMNMSDRQGTASSRCNRLCKMGLILRRAGHHGYQLAPDIDRYDIRITDADRRGNHKIG